MDRERHAGEQQPQSEPADEVDEDPLHDGRVDVEHVEDPCAQRRQHPPRPHGPAIPSGLGYDDPRNDSRRRHGESFREEGDARDYGRVTLYGFVVEREVVEVAPQDHAVEGGHEVGGGRGAVFEDDGADEGLEGAVFFPENEGDHAEGADDEGDEGSPGRPGVHYATLGRC